MVVELLLLQFVSTLDTKRVSWFHFSSAAGTLSIHQRRSDSRRRPNAFRRGFLCFLFRNVTSPLIEAKSYSCEDDKERDQFCSRNVIPYGIQIPYKRDDQVDVKYIKHGTAETHCCSQTGILVAGINKRNHHEFFPLKLIVFSHSRRKTYPLLRFQHHRRDSI